MIKVKPGNEVSNSMIELTRLNGTKFVLNAELIESVESTPDTVITLTTDKKLVVLEKKDEIINKFIQYKKRIFSQ